MEETLGGKPVREPDCRHPRTVPTNIESGPMVSLWMTACLDCGFELIEEVERPQDQALLDVRCAPRADEGPAFIHLVSLFEKHP
jgi:hypothetical protein